jgi:hypothetical protein
MLKKGIFCFFSSIKQQFRVYSQKKIIISKTFIFTLESFVDTKLYLSNKKITPLEGTTLVVE